MKIIVSDPFDFKFSNGTNSTLVRKVVKAPFTDSNNTEYYYAYLTAVERVESGQIDHFLIASRHVGKSIINNSGFVHNDAVMINIGIPVAPTPQLLGNYKYKLIGSIES